MKSKDELLGDYREMVENNALHKDVVFLEVLIDIRDALSAIENRLRSMNTQNRHPMATTPIESIGNAVIAISLRR